MVDFIRDNALVIVLVGAIVVLVWGIIRRGQQVQRQRAQRRTEEIESWLSEQNKRARIVIETLKEKP